MAWWVVEEEGFELIDAFWLGWRLACGGGSLVKYVSCNIELCFREMIVRFSL